MSKKEKDKKSSEDIIIKQEDGLTISYDKEDLENNYPSLMTELGDKKKLVKIDSVNYDLEQENINPKQSKIKEIPRELINPGVIDFLRRCKNNQEAKEILDYLLKRGEISHKEYENYIHCIEEENGLTNLINQSGGLKKPGYYMRKYYKNLGLIQKTPETKKDKANSKKN